MRISVGRAVSAMASPYFVNANSKKKPGVWIAKGCPSRILWRSTPQMFAENAQTRAHCCGVLF
jgi:hypothetical protein